jgi:predicted Zn finger-like uncharacterized protein
MDKVACPACAAVLNVKSMNVKLKGTVVKCSACGALLRTAGGLIAAIEDDSIGSISLESVPADQVALASDYSVAPVNSDP